MKAKIVHESSARLRVKLARPLTVREADLMQAWLSRESGAESVTVHERTGCVIFAYAPGGRDAVSGACSTFYPDARAGEQTRTMPGRPPVLVNSQDKPSSFGASSALLPSCINFKAAAIMSSEA